MSCLKSIVVFSALAIIVAVALITSAGAQDAPDARFGSIDVFWAPEEAAELSIGWERILFYWREIQPEGPDDWNTLHVREEWLDEANAQGRTVVGLLKNTPPWASEDGTEAGLPKGLHLPISDPENQWASFVRKVAAYYSVRNVHHWIIWNEPEIEPDVYGYEFSGTVEEYYRLLKVAYQVMKQVDPNAVIHLAGLTWWHDQEYLRRFLEVVSADPEAEDNNHFFDIVSLHIYFQTESVPVIMDSARAILDEFHVTKPIWINETNASPNIDPLWPVDRPSFKVDLDQQAWFIVQAHALGFAAGASRIGVYKLVDIRLPPGHEPFGILRPDFSPRPAYIAYRLAIEHLSGFRQVSQERQANYHLVTFARPEGQTRVMWARQPSATTLRVRAVEPSALLIDTLGDTERIRAQDGYYTIALNGARCHQQCIIGGPPLFLVEDFHGIKNRFGPPEQEVNANSVPRPTQPVTSTPPTPVSTPAALHLTATEAISSPVAGLTANQPFTDTVSAVLSSTLAAVISPKDPMLLEDSGVVNNKSGGPHVAASDLLLIGVGLVSVAGITIYIRRARGKKEA